MRSTIRNVGMAAVVALGCSAIGAQADIFGNWNWLKDSIYEKFNDDDWAALKAATKELLDDGAPGSEREWSNPDTGASGVVRVGSYKEENGLQCRWTEFNSVLGDQKSGQNYYYLCLNDEGKWKVARMR